jgi:predicted restriction endonuclease
MQADWENFVLESYQAVRDLEPEPKDNVELDENLIAVEQQDYAGSDKVVETKVRVGQSFFRKSVLSAYNYRCCITGLALPTLLVASHIVPWRKDVENRLNPKNGLALSTIHDRAFDQGIITISQDMTVLVSKEAYVQGDDFFSDTLMKYNGKPIFLPNKFQPHADFLAYHREIVFERWQRQE